MNSESNTQPVVTSLPPKPKYTGRDNYYFDESGDYEHHYADCENCDRSVFKRTLVDGLCEMCDEKSQKKKKMFKKK